MRRNSRVGKTRLFVQALECRIAPAFAEFLDPHPASGNGFGSSVVPLPNGNVVITSPNDDLGGTDAGAVYLFNGNTGALISTLRGSSANDKVGSGGITVLANGNFVVRSNVWDSPTGAADVGAVTWVDATTGLNGIVGSANSLVGSTPNDQVGSTGITALANGNYVVNSQNWDNGPGAVDAGAVTWGSGTKGVSGSIASANSLVSNTSNSLVGGGGGAVTELSNGNYVVRSPSWSNGAATKVGAVTWGSGTSGVRGVISAVNSLVGSTADDLIGTTFTALTNGNFVVSSINWNNGAATKAGAVTWVNGTTGLTGVVGASNSLVGGTTNDNVGSVIQPLANGNFLVRSPAWDNGAATSAGAVTFVNGLTGLVGSITSANSLVGSSTNDNVGNVACTLLANGNYVVPTPSWDSIAPAAVNAGAATWGSGATGVSGVVAAGNSLVGDSASDIIGTNVISLSNGHYVTFSSSWDDAVANVGAVTWCNGATGRVGVVSNLNSLVGSSVSDQVGSSGIAALPNGNFVVRSPAWDNGAVTGAGAATFVNGSIGLTGAVAAANSLVGSSTSDQVGSGFTVLANGNYVVVSPNWDNGIIADVGAVTWGSGNVGVSGTITAANSLIGSTLTDTIGSSGVAALANGNFVVRSPFWDNGAAADAGAATWGNGAGGTFGQLNAANSLVGGSSTDNLGASVITLPNGNYIVIATNWDNAGVVDAGAVTFGKGNTGVAGAVSAANSLVGSTINDQVGSTGVNLLSNGNYVVRSPNWDNGVAADAGAATWGSGATGVSGVVSSTNSLVGSTSGDLIGLHNVTALANGNYVVQSASWNNGAQANAGAVTWGDGATGIVGVVSATNSLVGSTNGDTIGNNVFALANGDYIVAAGSWDNGTLVDAGMMAWGNGTTGVRGIVSSANALVGVTGATGLNNSPILDEVNGTFIARFTTEQGGRVRVGSLLSGVIPTLNTVYVDDNFTSPAGTAITDADAGTPGNQPAITGETAFATIPEAIAHLVDGGTLILNAGTYPEDVAMARDFTWKPTLGVATVTGVISGPFGIIKEGGGVLALSGVNTFTGDVEIHRGFLRANTDSSFGNSANIVTASGLGSINVTGSFVTSRPFELSKSNLVIDNGKTLTYVSTTMNGGFVSGPGTLVTSGANLNNTTFNPSVSLTAFASTFGACAFHGLVTASVSSTNIFNQCQLTPSGQFLVNGTANLSFFESNGQTTVAGSLTNTGGLTTLGGGSVTTINVGGTFDCSVFGTRVAGGLVKNSGTFSTTGAGAITVDYNGLVKGTGTFGSIVTQNGGVFAPGSSPGTATTNQLNLNGDGRLEFEVSNATGTPGNVSGWDLVNVQPTAFSATGLMNYTATPTSKYIIQLKSRLDDGIGNTPGIAANFLPTQNFAWKFADGSNADTSSSGTFDPAAFTIDTTGFSNSFTGSFGVELRDGGKNLYVVYTKPTVTSLIVNNGAVQRSRLTTMQVNFSAPVDAAALGLITLTRTAATPSGTVGTIVQTGATGANGRILVSPSSGLVTNVTLTFDNADASAITAGVESGSLADGRWQLAIPAAGFTSILNDLNLLRLFGDADGNGTITALDFNAFRLQYGTSGPSIFDFNNDNSVTALDFNSFRLRYGVGI